ncbi:hypothetical protein GW17_00020763 [Ensete ventricosum]|nr:hypothetical protein GW17_00020763 [Ensete ventricosum]
MYRLPAGSGGTEALSKSDPTPTLLSEEPSYTETRHATGVVPSGNSRAGAEVEGYGAHGRALAPPPRWPLSRPGRIWPTGGSLVVLVLVLLHRVSTTALALP